MSDANDIRPGYKSNDPQLGQDQETKAKFDDAAVTLTKSGIAMPTHQPSSTRYWLDFGVGSAFAGTSHACLSATATFQATQRSHRKRAASENSTDPCNCRREGAQWRHNCERNRRHGNAYLLPSWVVAASWRRNRPLQSQATLGKPCQQHRHYKLEAADPGCESPAIALERGHALNSYTSLPRKHQASSSALMSSSAPST